MVRTWVWAGAVLMVVAGAATWRYTATGQTPAPSSTGQSSTAGAKPWTVSRTPWGDPDLQGVWTIIHFGRTVPLQRPPALADKVEWTQEEADARYDKNVEHTASVGGGVGTYGREFRDTERHLATLGIRNSRRTSLIVDPPDGRIPAIEDLRKRRAAQGAAARRPRPVHGVEDLGRGGRCLPSVFPSVMQPGGIDAGKRIVQSPGYVTILYEGGPPHVRVIPVAGQPISTIPQWWGHARGHWEGDTLVVETRHFNGRGTYHGGGAQMHLVERFTRTAANELDYRLTIEDPTAFTRPWTIAMNWLIYPGQYELVEYACNEGNYSLPVILRAAQMETQKTGVWVPVDCPLDPPDVED